MHAERGALARVAAFGGQDAIQEVLRRAGIARSLEYLKRVRPGGELHIQHKGFEEDGIAGVRTAACSTR